MYFHCTGSFICSENCGYSAPRVKGTADRKFHILSSGTRHPLVFQSYSVCVIVYKEYTSDLCPLFDVTVKECHNHEVLLHPSNTTDSSRDLDILNFLNSPGENLVLSPHSMDPLFVLDPKLANLDRVNYKTHSAFIRQFQFKPNHFSILNSLSFSSMIRKTTSSPWFRSLLLPWIS